MKLNNIKGDLLFEADVSTMKELVELAVKQKVNLSEADLPFANLSHANLSYADLSRANLSRAILSYADLSETDLFYANLCAANLYQTNLTGVRLFYANLSGADLHGANLSDATLTYANLSEAILTYANLSKTNLSGVKGFLDNTNNFVSSFKQTRSGVYVYKSIGNTTYDLNPNWVIKPGSYLEEVVNPNKTNLCGCGVNFGTREFCTLHYPDSDLWLCLIEWKDVFNVIVPYNTDGKARCARLKLIKKVK